MSLVHRMNAESRRAAIVDAAVRMFAERGFRGTTTRALADAVGVTEPVLYEHFRSKRELYAAIVDAKATEGMKRAGVVLDPFIRAKDDRGLFQRLGEFILDLYAEDQAYARLLLSVALENPELGSVFYERQKAARQGLIDYIRERIAAGAFRKDLDPELAARVFVGMISYQAQLRLLYKDEFGPDNRRIVQGMVDVFLNGIANHGKG